MNKCDCYSAIDGKGIESMRVRPPQWSIKDWISIDPCVWPFVKKLWDEGIQTGGSCCGHGKDKSSVVITRFEDINKAIMVAIDNDFDVKIFAWKDNQIDIYFGKEEGLHHD